MHCASAPFAAGYADRTMEAPARVQRGRGAGVIHAYDPLQLEEE